MQEDDQRPGAALEIVEAHAVHLDEISEWGVRLFEVPGTDGIVGRGADGGGTYRTDAPFPQRAVVLAGSRARAGADGGVGHILAFGNGKQESLRGNRAAPRNSCTALRAKVLLRL